MVYFRIALISLFSTCLFLACAKVEESKVFASGDLDDDSHITTKNATQESRLERAGEIKKFLLASPEVTNAIFAEGLAESHSIYGIIW